MNFKTLSVPQLQLHIRTISKDSENVIITAHARARMAARKVLDAEIYHCLRRSKIKLTPEEDMKTGHLVCRMECYGASRNLAVCVALEDDTASVIVVTVIVN